MKQDVGQFSEGSIRSHLFRLAGPMLIAALVNMLYSIVDRFFIGHMSVGAEAALTGVGLSAPLMDIFAAFINLFAVGSVAAFSMARGRGALDEAKQILRSTFYMLLLTASTLMILVGLFLKPLLYLLGATDFSFAAGYAYLQIYILGMIPAFISVGMNGFLNSQGYAWMGMLTTGIGAIINLILDPVFIYGLNWGVRGAAIATIIAQTISACWVLSVLLGKKLPIHLEAASLWQRPFVNPKLAREVLRMGLSSFTFQFTNFASHFTSNRMLLAYGGDLGIAVMTILISLRQVISLPTQCLTDAAKAIIAYNYGAKTYDRLFEMRRLLLTLSLSITGLATIALQLFPDVFISIFNTSPDILALGPRSLRLYFAAFYMMSLQQVGQTFFVGMGRAKEAVFFSFLRKLFVVVPLTLLLPAIGLGMDGVFLAEAVSQWTACTVCFVTMCKALQRLKRQSLAA